MEFSQRKSLQGRSGEWDASGSVYAFMPAHGESKASAVSRKLSRTFTEGLGLSVLLADFYARGFPLWGAPEAPQRLDGRTWGAFVTKGEAFDTLEAREAHPAEIPHLLDHARGLYQVTCADLTEATQVVSLEVLKHSDAIFVVSSADPASLDLLRYKVAWLRSVGLAENAAVLLVRTPGGCSAQQAEEQIGLPVSEVDHRAKKIAALAAWLAKAGNLALNRCSELAVARAC